MILLHWTTEVRFLVMSLPPELTEFISRRLCFQKLTLVMFRTECDWDRRIIPFLKVFIGTVFFSAQLVNKVIRI